eukprot:COSAG01_NODE_6811_length_3487_cov_1.657910_1_plen_105_part_00
MLITFACFVMLPYLWLHYGKHMSVHELDALDGNLDRADSSSTGSLQSGLAPLRNNSDVSMKRVRAALTPTYIHEVLKKHKEAKGREAEFSNPTHQVSASDGVDT